jgi:hypothetical protein
MPRCFDVSLSKDEYRKTSVSGHGSNSYFAFLTYFWSKLALSNEIPNKILILERETWKLQKV